MSWPVYLLVVAIILLGEQQAITEQRDPKCRKTVVTTNIRSLASAIKSPIRIRRAAIHIRYNAAATSRAWKTWSKRGDTAGISSPP